MTILWYEDGCLMHPKLAAALGLKEGDLFLGVRVHLSKPIPYPLAGATA